MSCFPVIIVIIVVIIIIIIVVIILIIIIVGLDSAVGIGTCYGLDGPGIESRWGGEVFAPVQTGPWPHPASCTVGTGSLSRE
jgi:hypothetical protein